MSTTPDITTSASLRASSGVLLALASAASFALSGSMASSLFDTGWTPGSVVLVRIGLACLVVAPFGLISLRGHWHQVRGRAGLVIAYGVVAVGGTQFAYFSAVQQMAVGPSILIEYTSPAAVVIWLWLVHGQRPGRLTVLGALFAAVGLVLVLDLFGGSTAVTATGAAWALTAMAGAAAYFIMVGNDDTGIPPVGFAWLGLVVGGVVLAIIGALGLMPVSVHSDDVDLAGATLAWWAPVLVLGVVTAGLAFCLGVVSARMLGARLASFVALFEVVGAVFFAWLLLDEVPLAIQLLGGLLILAGVVLVKLGEPSLAEADPEILEDPATRFAPPG
ncbi:MAG: DMT family transporter [Nocardioides sp.]